MVYLFSELPFLEGSRMTGVSHFTPAGARSTDSVALGQFINLPEGQDSEAESEFLGSHLPFRAGGFQGVYPDGNCWLLVLQHAPSDSSARLGATDRSLAMRDAMTRALAFNPGASVVCEMAWNRLDLVDVYETAGVSLSLVKSWSVHELVIGLLAECCDVPLTQIAPGYAAECAFPEVEHACEANVFTDVFARWSAREGL